MSRTSVRVTAAALALCAAHSRAMSMGDYTLEMGGRCPGYFILKWSGATPDRQHAIVYGSDAGQTIIPSGPCRGTVLGLAGDVAVVNVISTRDGTGAVVGYGGQVCHFFIQLLELGTCNPSNVVAWQ